MLVALRRDPSLDGALYDIGILCVQYGRWDDAIKFQQERSSRPRRLGSGQTGRHGTGAIAGGGPARSHSGRDQARGYDNQFLAAFNNRDPIKALIAANALAQRDATRWEGFALAGILHADSRAYRKSLKSLEAAIGLAPAARRPALQAAAEIARRKSILRH